MTTTTHHPEAPLCRAVYLDNTWRLTVACPLCGHLHTHGGGSRPDAARDALGHRASHCPTVCPTHGGHQRSNGYVLTDPHDHIGRFERTWWEEAK